MTTVLLSQALGTHSATNMSTPDKGAFVVKFVESGRQKTDYAEKAYEVHDVHLMVQ